MTNYLSKTIYGYSLPYKIMMVAFSFAILIVVMIACIDDIKEGNFYDLLVIGLPSLLLFGYILFTAFRRKLIFTNQGIEKHNFREIKILFDDIKIIKVFTDEMRVMSDGVTIPITKDIEDYKSIIKFLVRKLAPMPGIEIQGDRKFVEQILSEQ